MGKENIKSFDQAQIESIGERLKVGDEILIYKRTVIEHSASSGRKVNGKPALDQKHDYYLGVINDPKLEVVRILAKPKHIKFGTERFAQRSATYSHGSSVFKVEKPLTVTRLDGIWVGNDEIQSWLESSALNQRVYRELKEQLGEEYMGLQDRLTLGLDYKHLEASAENKVV